MRRRESRVNGRTGRSRPARRVRPAGRAVAVAAAAVLLTAIVTSAGATTYWKTDSYAGFLRGTASGVSILESGRVVPGPSLESLDVPVCDYVWSSVSGPRGAVYVTTGTPGKLCRADAGGGRVLFEMEDVDFPALALGWGGDVFVGTAPGGAVYRVDADGDAELFYETGQNYIWAMAFSERHGLLIGTGEEATVVALDERGNARTLGGPADLNVVTLAVVGDRVLAGTGGDGLLLDVTPGGETRVLYDTRYDEVSGIVAADDGTLLFSASTISVDQVLDEMADPSVPFGEGAVYRATDGGAYEIWRSPESPVVSLGLTPSGAVVAGTGSDGRVYAVEPGVHGLVADLDEAEILSIVAVGDATVVTTGTPGAVHRLEGPAAGGVYESRVFDAVTSATWGSCLATADRGDEIDISTRSGSLETPDATWSEWVPLEDGKVASPASRFLQWRAKFDSAAGTALRGVEIAYLRENVPPEVVSVIVSRAGEGFSPNGFGNGQATQTLASGLEVTYSLDAGGRDVPGVPPVARGMRTVEWDAFDPNGDELVFDLYVQSEDDDVWWLMEEGLDRSAHTWDSYSMPDGRYRMRVVASDLPANTSGSHAEAEGHSGEFVIDNTPPTVGAVKLSASGMGAVVTVDAGDAMSPIAAIEVSVDYGEWLPAHAADGMFDGLSEGGALELEELARGDHAVAVRAFDRAGNVGVRRVVVGLRSP